jgi:hypothetical protein
MEPVAIIVGQVSLLRIPKRRTSSAYDRWIALKAGPSPTNICASFITVVSIPAALISGSDSKILRTLWITEFKNSVYSRSSLSGEQIEFTVAPANRLLTIKLVSKSYQKAAGEWALA